MTLPDKTPLPSEEAPPDERFDRQLRISGWNQEALANARLGVVGDDPWLTGALVTSAAALGINCLTVVAPDLDERLLAAARGLHPELDLAFFPGHFSHFLLEELLSGCTVLVDLSRHALATKLLLTYAHREHLPLVRGYVFTEGDVAGLKLFTYLRGREWRDLLQVLPPTQLPVKLREGARASTGEDTCATKPLPPPSNSLPQPLKGEKKGWQAIGESLGLPPPSAGWEGALEEGQAGAGIPRPYVPGSPTKITAPRTINQVAPVLSLVTAGLVLEETKKLLLGEPVTPEVVSYIRTIMAQAAPPHPYPLPPAGGEGEEEPPGFPLSPGPSPGSAGSTRNWGDSNGTPISGSPENRKPKTQNPLAIVGAGALGNFVGLGLAALGFGPLTFIDPDPVEVTNLNRQILFWDAVGQPKAKALAQRLAEWFGIAARAEIAYVTQDSDLSGFSAVFDCTDNHESRIILSEKCRENGQILISGGTGVAAGQVVIFNPATGGPTPAELLGLYDLVEQREVEVRERERASCVYAPEPAVIMTNQIIGGLMADALRRLLGGEQPPNLFYDARGEKMLS